MKELAEFAIELLRSALDALKDDQGGWVVVLAVVLVVLLVAALCFFCWWMGRKTSKTPSDQAKLLLFINGNGNSLSIFGSSSGDVSELHIEKKPLAGGNGRRRERKDREAENARGKGEQDEKTT